MDLAATIASLTAERDRLRAEADKLDKAIAALRGLDRDEPSATAAVRPAVASSAPAPRASDSSKPATKDNRPASGVCAYAPCGKPFPISVQGRVREYCSIPCGKKERKAAARPAGERARATDPIPESASGMKARVAKMLAGGATPKSHFLERVKARNEEAAKRSAAAAGR